MPHLERRSNVLAKSVASHFGIARYQEEVPATETRIDMQLFRTQLHWIRVADTPGFRIVLMTLMPLS